VKLWNCGINPHGDFSCFARERKIRHAFPIAFPLDRFRNSVCILGPVGSSERIVNVTGEQNSVSRRSARAFVPAMKLVLPVLVLQILGAGAVAYAQNPSSASNPYFGSVTRQPVSQDTLQLSLDEAVRRGLENNLGLKESENSEKSLHGQKDQALQQFLPTITLTGDTGFYQHNLVALGFGPDTIAKFLPLFGGTMPAGFSTITHDDLTEGQLHFSQTLFSGPVISGWKAAGAAERAAYFDKMSSRAEVVQQVATIYLRSIADGSEVDNAKALVAEAQVLYDHEHAAHEAGTVANLDELRARVQLQTQQQSLISAGNQLGKDLILLKREIGIDPGQQIALTDPAPYSNLAAQTLDEILVTAYKDRQDYQTLKNQAVEYKAIYSAYRSQRLPSVKFNSYYGVSDVSTVGSHGNFVAVGTLSMPIFREARLRGDEDASRAQMQSIAAQLADLRNHIEEQVRDALLDVSAASQLVDVARSNVDLATRALSDETDRVNAGVDDNLPLVEAQSTLAEAQTNLVESLYRYNISKVTLARSVGVLEEQYRTYLGR
jgi:outer membrane protein TolC